MAYITRWTVTFKDINDSIHTIYIQQEGWTGGQTELIAGANPLVWDEDSSEDLTKGVRGITGRLQVVEEKYGDLADLYPTTPLQFRVQCQNVFVGFIKVQNNTNPWVCGPRTLTLNIVSPLALSYDIPMPITHELGMRKIGTVMAEMMNTMGYDYVSMPKGDVDDLGEFFSGSVRGWLLCPYSNDKDYRYGTEDEIFEPVSVGMFIEMICERHSLMAHDAIDIYSASLVFSRMGDTNGTYRWSYTNISNGNYSTAELLVDVGAQAHALLADFSVADNSNSESLVHPYSYIDILHSGDAGDDRIVMPTVQSQYLPSSPYTLTPRGLWLTNLHSAFALGNVVSSTQDETTSHDTLFFNNENQGSAIDDNILLFSVTFYNINRAKLYQLKYKYLHLTDGQHDAIKISARGKCGWYIPNGGQTPTNPNEYKYLHTLNGDPHSTISYPSTLYEVETSWLMIPDDYITINFYSGSNGLKNLYMVEIELSAKAEYTSTTRWQQQPYVERILGHKGDKPMSIKMRLNDTFFSNFYQTSYVFVNEYPTFLLNSQKRLQVTVQANQLNKIWYLYRYYINDNTENWRIIAITYNVRDNTYKLTLHQIRTI